MTLATEAEIHRYTSGMCHAFAVAMHRLYGARLSVVTNPDDPVWVDDEDDDNFIPSVIHVFATLNGLAYDIETVIPETDILSYCEERFDVDDLQDETLDSESELVAQFCADGDEDSQCDGEDEPVRPLLPLTPDDIQKAMTVARRIYGDRLQTGAVAA